MFIEHTASLTPHHSHSSKRKDDCSTNITEFFQKKELPTSMLSDKESGAGILAAPSLQAANHKQSLSCDTSANIKFNRQVFT